MNQPLLRVSVASVAGVLFRTAAFLRLQMLQVALGRPQHNFLSPTLDDRPAPTAAVHGTPVDSVKLQAGNCANDSLNSASPHRDQVRVAIHEADPAAVLHGQNAVSGKERPFAA